MSKKKVAQYPLAIPLALYEAVDQVARERAFKLDRRVYMKDVIITALLLDPQIAKYYNQNKQKEK